MIFIRFFDVLFSFIGLVVLSPFLIVFAIIIRFDGHGRSLYQQERVGQNRKPFKLIKFRSMFPNSDKGLQITVGNADSRITPVGRFMRKYKIDELPQLINVLKGDMSLVGPRPEVKKYVDLYTKKQLEVLSVRPGITDFASIEFVNENEILAFSENPEEEYVNNILPKKIEISLGYASKPSVSAYFRIIFLTIKTIFISGNKKKSQNE
ncbi:MAG TPA: sugar transferase [Tenuifilaceae bacterium]|nr:sugar transferase [Tenuifilaceae bacterium]HPE18063.1 sugar transferase [Tenuifilaceae bacterium]HPJ45433.1 sugar transferase [Tenuifilaceae bacterium]HPQ34050.1 sugar transferase [Tenuifilaceae bacterium]HRX69252.1 sugar transferase [Tenuifilaceae bacterium]